MAKKRKSNKKSMWKSPKDAWSNNKVTQGMGFSGKKLDKRFKNVKF